MDHLIAQTILTPIRVGINKHTSAKASTKGNAIVFKTFTFFFARRTGFRETTIAVKEWKAPRI